MSDYPVLQIVDSGVIKSALERFVADCQPTCYLWKRKYFGVGVSELRELRQLREENGRVKRLA